MFGGIEQTAMKQLWVILILMTMSCARPKDATSGADDTTSAEITSDAVNNQLVNLPEFVRNANIPGHFIIDTTHVLHGDFNADEQEDFASLVTNQANGYTGVLIVHNTDNPDYIVFGAGETVDGMDNLDWIGTFSVIPKGEAVAPTSVDEETGDIIGADSTKEFHLVGDGIYMHVDESEGGGILFWKDNKYEWYHVE